MGANRSVRGQSAGVATNPAWQESVGPSAKPFHPFWAQKGQLLGFAFVRKPLMEAPCRQIDRGDESESLCFVFLPEGKPGAKKRRTRDT